MDKATVGRIVHYVSRGSADGRFPATCRAAIIAGVDVPIPVNDGVMEYVELAVLNPTGLFFDTCPHDEGIEHPRAVGTWHWPERV